jgi:hypothetical protein
VRMEAMIPIRGSLMLAILSLLATWNNANATVVASPDKQLSFANDNSGNHGSDCVVFFADGSRRLDVEDLLQNIGERQILESAHLNITCRKWSHSYLLVAVSGSGDEFPRGFNREYLIDPRKQQIRAEGEYVWHWSNQCRNPKPFFGEPVGTPIHWSIWEAASEGGSITLGVSASQDKRVLLNTLHTAKPDAVLASDFAQRLVVKTFDMAAAPQTDGKTITHAQARAVIRNRKTTNAPDSASVGNVKNLHVHDGYRSQRCASSLPPTLAPPWWRRSRAQRFDPPRAQFATTFPDEPIVVTLSRQLSWSHFVSLIPCLGSRTH